MFEPGTGVIEWLFGSLGIHSPGFGLFSIVVGLSYLWLPYMILPIYAGLDRLPNSLIEASGDLGAGNFATFRKVVLPLLLPSVQALCSLSHLVWVITSPLKSSAENSRC
jgi:putative spermidine/putrescine transport system permease protein